MLDHTFCHIPGVGLKTERRLWDAGVTCWRAALDGPLPVGGARAESLRRDVAESVERLAQGDAAWFAARLPAAEQWRLFGPFRDRAAYIDIETTGLGDPDDFITTIAVYDGREIRTYVQDDNLFDFRDDMDEHRLLVSYNGKSFDVPWLRRAFGLPLRNAHIDLRYVLASLGYRGGLKGCEAQLGLDRGGLADVDGYFAVVLWHDWRERGNRKALDTLLAYNITDTVNLETLMVMAWNLKLAGIPFCDEGLALPDPPAVPYEADAETIARLRGQAGPAVPASWGGVKASLWT